MAKQIRDALIENQKTRTDLLRWKMILVAAIGAAASGAGGIDPSHCSLLFSLIPLVCVYVDLLSRDQTLRILSITRYLQMDKPGVSYEAFAGYGDKVPIVGRREAFRARSCTSNKTDFALIAQDMSTLGILLILVFIGLVFWIPTLTTLFGFHTGKPPIAGGSPIADAVPITTIGGVLIISSIIGLIFTFVAYLAYLRQWAGIERTATEIRSLVLPQGSPSSSSAPHDCSALDAS
jgi:hypothetical protein